LCEQFGSRCIAWRKECTRRSRTKKKARILWCKSDSQVSWRDAFTRIKWECSRNEMQQR
jgi:hypothetical protein